MKINNQIEIKGSFVKQKNSKNKFIYKDDRIICKRKGSIVELKGNAVLIQADVTGIDKVFFEIKNNKVRISNVFKDFLDNEINNEFMEIQTKKGYVPYPFTLLKNVRKAPPGLVTIIKLDKLDKNRKACLCYEKSKELKIFAVNKKFNKKNFRKEFSKLLAENAKDVKGLVSSFSGGFDSLFLTTIYKDKIKHFLHFSEDNEVKIDYYKSIFKNISWTIAGNDEKFSEKDRRSYFESADEPCCDPSGFAEYLMIRKLAENKRAKKYPVMNGQSCDGIFGNGRKYFQEFAASKLPSLLRNKMPGKYAVDNWLFSHLYTYSVDTKRRFIEFYLSNYHLDNIKADEFKGIYETYLESIANDSTNFFAALVIMLRYSVYELEKIKTAAKAFNVKYYLPFMSTNVIRHAFSIPAKYKIGFKIGKRILIDSYSQIGKINFVSRDFVPQKLKEKFIGESITEAKYRKYYINNWIKYNKGI